MCACVGTNNCQQARSRVNSKSLLESNMGNPNLFICIHVCVYMFYTYILFVLSNSNRNVFCDSVCVCAFASCICM